MRARCWTVVGSIALVSCGPSAGEVFNDSSVGEVPEALAVALIPNAAEESRIFVGAPPATLEAALPIAAELAVVGGLTRDNGGTVVFEVTGSPEAALSVYADRIEREGWVRAPNEQALRGGFLPSHQPIAGTWCTETHWLRASSTSFAGSEYLRVRYYEVEMEPTPCENAQMRSQMSMGRYGLRIPLLEPPPNSEVRLSGGGGSTNDANMNALVVTHLGAQELFDHYARQVTRDGWEAGTVMSNDGLAMGRWSARDDTDEPALGVLAIWSMPEPDTYRAWIRMERVRAER